MRIYEVSKAFLSGKGLRVSRYPKRQVILFSIPESISRKAVVDRKITF